MYSGTTLTKMSGRIIGSHQKIDRIARKHLAKISPKHDRFPSIKQILAFEGKNGPDAIKRKSPAQDEPWHYFNPFDGEDAGLLDIIDDHYQGLIDNLKIKNQERSAFEAAWLAHAIVDGLTPAHHFPYEAKLVELRGGEGIDQRTTIKEKLVMPGETGYEKLKNNWKMWGPKGLILTHGLFEFGVATLIAPLGFGEAKITPDQIKEFNKIGLRQQFQRAAREVAVSEMYKNYYRHGWTPRLAYQVRHVLGPTIIQTVTLAWHGALENSQS